SLLKGGRHCRPFLATKGLSNLLIDPALFRIQEAGAEARFHWRLKELQFSHSGWVSALHFPHDIVAIKPDDHVILGVPWAVAERLLPNTDYALGAAAIWNIHFAIPPHAAVKKPEFLGMVGTAA